MLRLNKASQLEEKGLQSRPEHQRKFLLILLVSQRNTKLHNTNMFVEDHLRLNTGFLVVSSVSIIPFGK